MAKRRIWIALATAGSLVVVSAVYAGSGPRTVLTSVGPGDEQTNGSTSTYWRSLSGNGKRAVFTTDDDDFPGADGTDDAYVRDLAAGKTILLSRTSSGEAADEDSGDDPAIAANGRFAAFTSNADNLPGGVGGVFLRDTKKGKTKLVSVNSQGDPATGSEVGRPELSADGRYVSFEANDDDFPGADGTIDAYVHDRRSDKTSLVTQSSDGDPVDGNSTPIPSLSGNGRFVVFTSNSDVLPGANSTNDVFIRDRKKGTTTLVSKTPGGDPVGGGNVNAGAVSFSGRYVVFDSFAASLGADPSDSVFVRDRKRGTTKAASIEDDGDVAGGDTASISANGRYVAYESDDDDLPGVDGISNVYRYDRQTKQTTLISRSTSGDAGDDDSFYASISGGGGHVSFTSRANNLTGGEDETVSNSFVRGPLD